MGVWVPEHIIQYKLQLATHFRFLPKMETAFRSQELGRTLCCFFLLVLLSCAMERSAAQNYRIASIKLVPESPVVGGEVVLMVSSVGKIKTVNWYRAPGEAIYQNNVVLTYAPNSPKVTYGPQYTYRETGLPDASLKISNLLASDTGNYTVQIVVFTGRMQQTVFLKVADGPLQRNSSPMPVTIGAIVGSLVAIASVTIAAVLLYKMYHSTQRRSHSKPFLHPHTETPNFRTSVTSDGYIDPREIHSPSRPYTAVLPALPTELEYTDQNPYSSLRQ